MTLERCASIDNIGEKGGAIYNFGAGKGVKLTISGVSFENNKSANGDQVRRSEENLGAYSNTNPHPHCRARSTETIFNWRAQLPSLFRRPFGVLF